MVYTDPPPVPAAPSRPAPSDGVIKTGGTGNAFSFSVFESTELALGSAGSGAPCFEAADTDADTDTEVEASDVVDPCT